MKIKIFFAFAFLTVAMSAGMLLLNQNDPAELSASVLQSLEELKEVEKIIDSRPIDLSIEKVKLRQVQTPSIDFPYYKYNATIILRNNSTRDLINGKVILRSSESQKEVFVRNTMIGLAIRSEKNYIIDDYEIVLPGEYNGEKLNFEIEFAEREDPDLSNNKTRVDIVQWPAKISEMNLIELDKSGYFILEYSVPEEFKKHGEFQMFSASKLDVSSADKSYREFYKNGNIYSYEVIKNKGEFYRSENWKKKEVSEYDSHFIPISTKDQYFYFKLMNPESGQFVLSEIIHLPGHQAMRKMDLVKYFVNYTGLEKKKSGKISYKDVKAKNWFYPYVHTMASHDLIDKNEYFEPYEIVNRDEVLSVVAKYFGIVSRGAKSGDLYATKGYLHNLINAHSKSN